MTRTTSMRTGQPGTRLIVLRGNSGAGKSTAARLIRGPLRDGLSDPVRDYYRNDVALIEQDYVRRILLGEHDRRDGINVDLIEQAARLALDGGFDVIIEGMLFAERYATMLTALTRDHLGSTHHWYFDASLEVTQGRHLHRPDASQVPVARLKEWYRPRDLLTGVVQSIVPGRWTATDTARAILTAVGRATAVPRGSSCPAA